MANVLDGDCFEEEEEIGKGVDELIIDDETVAKEEQPVDELADLKRQLSEERKARVDAENKVQTVTRENSRVKADSEDSDMRLLNTAIDRLNEEAAMLKSSFATLMQQGEFDKAIEFQESLAKNVQNRMKLETGRDQMVAKAKKPKDAESEIENTVKNLSARSAAWIRAHPEYIKDPALNKRLMTAHSIAVEDGHATDSDGYFKAMEKRLGITKDEEEVEVMSEAAKTVSRRDTQPPAAPSSRTPAGATRPGTVRLTAAEVEAAEIAGITPQEYVKNKRELEKEGAFK